MATLTKALTEALRTHEEREATYGPGGHLRLGAAMAAMFPEGLLLESPEDFARYYLLEMVVAKANRYATNWHDGGHRDSAHDAAIYALLLEAEMDARPRKEEPAS